MDGRPASLRIGFWPGFQGGWGVAVSRSHLEGPLSATAAGSHGPQSCGPRPGEGRHELLQVPGEPWEESPPRRAQGRFTQKVLQAGSWKNNVLLKIKPQSGNDLLILKYLQSVTRWHFMSARLSTVFSDFITFTLERFGKNS